MNALCCSSLITGSTRIAIRIMYLTLRLMLTMCSHAGPAQLARTCTTLEYVRAFSMQMEDGVLLEGKVEECRAAFYAADTSGDGLLGAPSWPQGRTAEHVCWWAVASPVMRHIRLPQRRIGKHGLHGSLSRAPRASEPNHSRDVVQTSTLLRVLLTTLLLKA